MKHTLRVAILCIITLIALFLRLWQLPNIPVGLHGDEASIGYNAYSLLKTGRDQNGNPHPLTIDQFGDFRPAGYHYLDIPFIKALGLNTLAVRLPSALFGIATVLLMYFFVYELFSNSPLALACAAGIAISPWHIIISRATSESVVAMFFVMLGSMMFFRIVKSTHSALRSKDRDMFRVDTERLSNVSKQTPWPLFVISGISLIVSFLFYHNARLFIPLFIPLAAAGVMFLQKKSIKTKGLLILFSIIIAISLVLILKTSEGGARPTSVSIFNIPGGDRQIFQQIGEDGTQNALLTRLLHNKLLFYGQLFLTEYSRHFTIEYLFGTTGYPMRYQVPWSSMMYLADLPFLLFGFAVLLVDGIRQKKYVYLIPLAWLAIGALPAGLTWEDIPNVQRASLMLPALIVISTFGLFSCMELMKRRLMKMIVISMYLLLLLYGCTVFFHNYFVHLLRHEPWYRSASEPQLIEKLGMIQNQYQKIVMTTEGNNNFIFYLFYKKFDPATFQKMGSPSEHDGLRFENILYTSQRCPLGTNTENPVSGDPGTIYVNQASCKLPVNVDILDTARTPDGIPAYYILKVNPNWKPLEK